MEFLKYPSEQAVNSAITGDEPLLVLISFDGERVILSQIDEAMEHNILLAKAGYNSTDIDKYFRIVLDSDGADWTFVCPTDYKSITDKRKRISEFYRDGFAIIASVISELGYMVGLNIPKRYRNCKRHIDYISNNEF